MCDPRVRGALLFRCMVWGSVGILATSPGFAKCFCKSPSIFASQFCNLKALLKLGGDFAAISKLGDDFAAISQLQNECTGLPNGSHVPKSGFAAQR